MAPIAGQPLIEHIMDHFASYGFADFILCVKDDDHEIAAHFKQTTKFDSVQVVKTGNDTPTGGRLKRIAKLITEPTFLLSYGDGVSDVNIQALLDFHHNHGKWASLTAIQPHNQYGILKIDEQQSVLKLIEKPKMKEWVNGGFFVFQSAVFNQLSAKDILETDLLSKLASNQQLRAFYHQGFWQSMDTYKDYEALNEKFTQR